MKWRCIMQNKQQKRQAEKLQKSIQQQRRNQKSDKLSSEKRKDGNTSFLLRTGKFFSRKEVPTTAQQSIPYQEIYPDGICRVDEHFFTKTLEFFDINYQLAQNEDKTLIFENYCDFLNYFDSSIRVQLSYVTNSNAGEGLIFYGNVIIPFVDHFPKDTELYRIMTTRPEDLAEQAEKTR